MAYAVEWLLRDTPGLAGNAASVVRRLWHQLERAGFTTPGVLGFEPHLTTSVFGDCEPTAVGAALAGCELGVGRRVSFSGFGVFRREDGVVYLAASRTGWMREVQTTVHRRLAGVVQQPWAHYAPDAWVPHCTLAERVPADDIDRALAVCAAGFIGPTEGTLDGEVAEVRLVRFLPPVVVGRWR